jgi:hypothetical protein
MTDQRVKELADELERLVPPQIKGPDTSHQLSPGITVFGRSLFIHPDRIPPGSLRSLQSLMDEFNPLGRCMVRIAISKPLSSDETVEKDSNAFGTISAEHYASANTPVTLYYSQGSIRLPRKLTVRLPACEFTADNWKSNGKIVGIDDLTGAKFTIFIHWPIDNNDPKFPFYSALHLAHTTVDFGKYKCTLETSSAKSAPARDNRSLIMCASVLPDAAAILNGKAYQFSDSDLNF